LPPILGIKLFIPETNLKKLINNKSYYYETL
jgi:hypothetical protein